MGADESRRRSRAVEQCTPHLPQHIIEHIGKVLRNRCRGDLLIPLPGEMLAMLEKAKQSRTLIRAERE
ncbi:hypothetical protein MAE02_62860 [Microvirga aerophila]|uniref:Uncharacterized protein n=1 Tax=Microvirga aerophila TaxID=670291 RepID=A0A512C300_9HYPH|nr:hypothetical protein MAE02_62860 [Microvirga aerophila]